MHAESAMGQVSLCTAEEQGGGGDGGDIADP